MFYWDFDLKNKTWVARYGQNFGALRDLDKVSRHSSVQTMIDTHVISKEDLASAQNDDAADLPMIVMKNDSPTPRHWLKIGSGSKYSRIPDKNKVAQD